MANQQSASPTPTEHAKDRWDDRTPSPSVDLRTAWIKAHSIQYVREFFNKGEDDPCDEIRLYHALNREGEEYTMLLLSRSGILVTTYPYTGVSDHLVEAYLDELVETTVYYE